MIRTAVNWVLYSWHFLYVCTIFCSSEWIGFFNQYIHTYIYICVCVYVCVFQMAIIQTSSKLTSSNVALIFSKNKIKLNHYHVCQYIPHLTYPLPWQEQSNKPSLLFHPPYPLSHQCKQHVNLGTCIVFMGLKNLSTLNQQFTINNITYVNMRLRILV